MPAQRFARSLDAPLGLDACWAVLTDVHQVASWVSIVGAVTEHERLARYAAVLEDRVGPFKLRADLEIAVSTVGAEHPEARSVHVHAAGDDRQVGSRIVVDATLDLAGGATGTTVAVDGSYEVSGRVASLGTSVIRAKGNKVLEEFFTNAARVLK